MENNEKVEVKEEDKASLLSQTVTAAAAAMEQFASADREYIQQQVEEYKNLKEEEPEEEEEGVLLSTARAYFEYLTKYAIKPFLIGLYVAFLTLYGTYEGVQLCRSVWMLDCDLLDFGIYRIVLILASFVVLAFSSLYEFWNYHNRKKYFFYLINVNMLLITYALLYRLTYMLVVPLLVRIPISADISVAMLVALSRFILIVLLLLMVIPLTYRLFKAYSVQGVMEVVLEFRLGEHVDFRRGKKYLYDVKAIRYMQDGKRFTIREKDRSLHMLLDGVTGAGKTSLSIVKIAGDIDRKVVCEDEQKKKMVKMLRQGKAYMTKAFDNIDYNPVYFRPKEGHEKEFKKYLKKYRSAGLTIVAPDASLTDKVYEYCKLRKIPCNRVDPLLIPGTPNRKEGWRGCNPLYISPDTPSWQFNQRVVKKATLMADVLLSIYEMKGKSDAYFVGLNRAGTTSVSICLLLTFPHLHPGVAPTPADVQAMLNDFNRIRPYYEKLRDLPCAKNFGFVLDFIANDMLGAGAARVNEQIRGLRTIFNEFLVDPLIRDVLCSQDSIDMDRMLSRGEVTVFNFAWELGQTVAVGFGQFFMLSFVDAVVRRPGDGSALLHFFDVDEFPLLLHPDVQPMVTLFRKFNTGTTLSMQSLDQFNRSETTKFLRGVIQGNCAHQIIYGRASSTEMKLYCELAGKKNVLMEQETISQTSITMENTSLSSSTRTTPTQENVLEGGDIRNRKFQEVNVFSVIDGSTIPPFHGRTFFLPQSRWHKVHRRSYRWDKLFEKYHNPINMAPEAVLTHAPYEAAVAGVSEKVKGTVYLLDRGGENVDNDSEEVAVELSETVDLPVTNVTDAEDAGDEDESVSLFLGEPNE